MHLHKISFPLVLVAGFVGLMSPTATAAEPDDLAAEDYYRADPIPVPSEFLDNGLGEPEGIGTNVMFINFEDQTIT